MDPIICETLGEFGRVLGSVEPEGYEVQFLRYGQSNLKNRKTIYGWSLDTYLLTGKELGELIIELESL